MSTQFIIDVMQSAGIILVGGAAMLNQWNHRRHLRDHVEYEIEELAAATRPLVRSLDQTLAKADRRGAEKER